jgi:hypothetical protein
MEVTGQLHAPAALVSLTELLNRKQGRLQSRSLLFGKQKNLLFFLEFETIHNLLTTPPTTPRSLSWQNAEKTFRPFKMDKEDENTGDNVLEADVGEVYDALRKQTK